MYTSKPLQHDTHLTICPGVKCRLQKRWNLGESGGDRSSMQMRTVIGTMRTIPRVESSRTYLVHRIEGVVLDQVHIRMVHPVRSTSMCYRHVLVTFCGGGIRAHHITSHPRTVGTREKSHQVQPCDTLRVVGDE